MIRKLLFSSLFFVSCGFDSSGVFYEEEYTVVDVSKPIAWKLCPDRNYGRYFSCTKEPIDIKYVRCCTPIVDDNDTVCKKGLFKCPLKDY